jgi:hypothetical protein
MLEYCNGYVAIHPKFAKLTTPLRTAVENGEDALDKEAISHDNLMDAFRMSLQFWHYCQKNHLRILKTQYTLSYSNENNMC